MLFDNPSHKKANLYVIKKSKKLSRLIAEKGLDESSKSMAELTNALNKALWGVEWLENFDRTLQLTKTEIQIAVAYVEENLSKVNITTISQLFTPLPCAHK